MNIWTIMAASVFSLLLPVKPATSALVSGGQQPASTQAPVSTDPSATTRMALPVAKRSDLPTIYLVGDSTVRNGHGDGAGGQWGWGDFLANYFDSNKINVANRAIGGRSSRTYIAEGRWDELLEMLKPGDFVIFQFGHNDSGPLDDTSRARGTLPGVGEESREIDNPITKKHEVVHTYGWYMRKYVRDTLAKKATPIVCSPIPRKLWKDEKVIRNRDNYGGWAEQVANSEHVAFIDLNGLIADRYDALGEAAVEPLFADPHTHTSLAGAKLNVECVVAGLKAIPGNPLAAYFSRVPMGQGTQVSPAAPLVHARFVVQGDQFLLDGEPFQIISGEMHYLRIPREYWRARLEMARAMGLNTISTYVFWNVHEPTPGVYNFSGNADLAEFIREAQQEGFKVLLRAGPYSCAEWEFGGFPAWLMKDPHMREALRSNDPAFMISAERWIRRLAAEVAPLQVGRGGPVIGIQIENEYGNFGSDAAYMEHLHRIFIEAGLTDALLYTANPAGTIAKGSIPGVLAAVNFGIGHAEAGLSALENFRPGEPLVAAEYWPGWFDHWGQPHQTRPLEQQIRDLDFVLRHNAGINIYMFHGGTSFGMMSGSSWTRNQFLPDVTSYDYDAPLDEAGHPTPKFYAYRNEIAAYLGHALPPVPQAPDAKPVAPFSLTSATPLWSALPAAVHAQAPESMEQLGQSYGWILYRTTIRHSLHGDLQIAGLNDYALIYNNSRLVGTLDRTADQSHLHIASEKPVNRLDILVENSGRINSTRMIRQETKGIDGAVTLDGNAIQNWQIYSMPMNPASIADPPAMPGEAVAQAKTDARSTMGGPAFYRGNFRVDGCRQQMPDTFLDVRDLGKGAVWINGHPIGRYWSVGPQQTLYVPGPWIRCGENDVVVLDVFARKHMPRLSGLAQPILDAPTAQLTAAPDENVAPSHKP